MMDDIGCIAVLSARPPDDFSQCMKQNYLRTYYTGYYKVWVHKSGSGWQFVLKEP